MSKNIVVCLDGTWNDKDDFESLSNVAITHKMSLNDAATQVTYYDEGVGTDGWYDKKLGGLHGAGLSKNVREAYSFLAEQFNDGDNVYLFGFSRGAFTARSLAGFLYNCGLPASGNTTDVEAIYKQYKQQDSAAMANFKASNRPCPVQFLGVWDTVGALGIPVSFLRDGSNKVFGFHDITLNPEVNCACHAVSIDEKRASFEPTLWEETQANRGRIHQVWFAGVHSDIGGGYPERHLSDIALKWMCTRAAEHGWLESAGHDYAFNPDPSKPVHSSAFKLFGREIAVEDRDAPPSSQTNVRVHRSVLEKMNSDVGYVPVALQKHVSDKQTLEPYEVVD